jgi:hypothetical protein
MGSSSGLAVPGLVNLFKLSAIYGTSPKELYADLYGTIVNRMKDEPNSRAALFAETAEPPIELVPNSPKK